MTRIFALSLALLAALSSAAWSAPYPTRPVEIVVPYGAGGSTDLVARTLAQQLQTRLGQPVVVVNKPGASGTSPVTAIGVKSAIEYLADFDMCGITPSSVVKPSRSV